MFSRVIKLLAVAIFVVGAAGSVQAEAKRSATDLAFMERAETCTELLGAMTSMEKGPYALQLLKSYGCASDWFRYVMNNYLGPLIGGSDLPMIAPEAYHEMMAKGAAIKDHVVNMTFRDKGFEAATGIAALVKRLNSSFSMKEMPARDMSVVLLEYLLDQCETHKCLPAAN